MVSPLQAIKTIKPHLDRHYPSHLNPVPLTSIIYYSLLYRNDGKLEITPAI